jgi:hypothetical protein
MLCVGGHLISIGAAGEDPEGIQTLLFRALGPTSRRKMFSRIEDTELYWGRTLSLPFLHILVKYGLATICRNFLDAIQNKTPEHAPSCRIIC